MNFGAPLFTELTQIFDSPSFCIKYESIQVLCTICSPSSLLIFILSRTRNGQEEEE